MRVTLLYFAAARDAAHCAQELADLPEGADAGAALAWSGRLHPGILALSSRLRVAVDRAFVPLDAPLRDGAEVALIPPVAGG
jgi:molybdopterin synthase catalytic subunit